MKDQTFIIKDKILQIIAQEEEEPHAHKPFMAKVPVKATPIGYQFHQIDIPQFNPQTALKPSAEKKIKWQNLQIQPSKPVFLKSRINEQELLKYLSFVQNYLEQKIPDYFLQTSRQRTRSMAINLLHESDYNYTRAKFYILFPYYKTYNAYKCHQPLLLSNEEMQHKINAHIQSLKSSKQNDLMKWVKTIQNQMQSRIHISKINTYMEIARQNKYEIPDSIKDIIDRSTKIGKEIKKNILNSKNSLQKLQSIKTQLLDNKIVTNEMIHFQQAVARAQQWIKKQIKFQQEYFTTQQLQSGQINFILKDKQFFKQFGKIQYRTLQSLVNEYNSLPLSYPSFIKTTLILYQDTNKLINKLPSLNKAAKTRKSEQGTGIIKIQRKLISQILNQINRVPVQHQDFVNFQFLITDGLQQLQRINMFLQDIKYEKNLKILYQYQKLLIDIPIQNDVQKKINEKIEYYQLIDRIRKDISNPSKYDSLKDQLIKLKQKGYQTLQHAKLQSRVMTCMGWHESQQMIRQQKRVPNRTYLVMNEKIIRSKLIKYQQFQSQLFSARNQLNIPDDILKESEQRLQKVNILRQKINKILDQNQPELSEMLILFKNCYQNGITFLQFQQFYQKLINVLIMLAKIHYLLNTSQQFSNNTNMNYFYFTNLQTQRIVQFVCQKKHQIKDLRTKQTGDQIIQAVNNMYFPREINQWKLFQVFMRKAQQWSDRAMKIIQDFKNNQNQYNTRQVIQQSRHCLHSKLIEQQLNKIQIALKWRQKIQRKMMDKIAPLFSQQDQQFILKLQKDLQIQQQNYCSQQQMMYHALQYMNQNSQIINSILQKITLYPTEKLIVLKLSEMNKFVKQIDRQIQKYQIKDKVIDQLKEQLQIQLLLNQDWKQRYLAIKRFEKKKIGQPPNLKESASRRKDDDQQDNQISFDFMKQQKQQENHQFYPGGYVPKATMVSYSPSLLTRPRQLSQAQKKKYIIKNGQFCWYYRMLLMLFEFYNGWKLRFVVQQFVKLKNTLADIYRLIEKYNMVYEKPQRSDTDFEYLQSETCKIPIFFKQSYLITNKFAQIQAWKNIADHVLRSVPVINMQVKARKPQQLRQLLQKRKNQELLCQNRLIEEQVSENTSKRRRKPNQLYENDDITLFRDDILISKTKKRKNAKMHHHHNNLHTVSSVTQQYRMNHNKKIKQQKQFYRQDKQSIQRIQQLLNGGNLELMIEDPKQYCICRNGILNQNSLMVQCEQCQQWYHIQCVGIKKHQAKSQDNYLCVGCKSLSQGYQFNYGYFWDHNQKISQYSLIQIYEEGKSLGVTISQLNKISLVYNAMFKWKQDANELLKKLIQQNPKDLSQYEEEIYPLYLHSLWLPTIHYEAVHLKRLMKYIRGT